MRPESSSYQPLALQNNNEGNDDADREDSSEIWEVQKQGQFARLQGGTAILASAFLILGIFFSLFGLNPPPKTIIVEHSSYPNWQGQHNPAETSARALSWSEKNDLTWPNDKCRREFPLFYPQLEAVAQYWKSRGGLTKDIVDSKEAEANKNWGYIRLIIRNGKVYIRSFLEGPQTRNAAVIQLFTMAVRSWPQSHVSMLGGNKKGVDLPPIDIILSPGDDDTFQSSGGWTLTKDMRDPKHNGTWLFPDFGFISWPEVGAGLYEDSEEQAEIVEKQYPWEKKDNRLFWRGFIWTYAPRLDLFKQLAASLNKDTWADVRETSFDKNLAGMAPLVTLPDHCQRKYLIHTEGASYSGRSKFLFSCKSVTIAHPLQWTQHFHPALNPDSYSRHQNFIQMPGPLFGGLEQLVKELQSRDSSGEGTSLKTYNMTGRASPKQIAENAARTLRDRYLTPAATMCYTRAALLHYASVANSSSWGPNGPEPIPGEGVAAGSSRNKDLSNLKGDIEERVWRLFGGPTWPPVHQGKSTTA